MPTTPHILRPHIPATLHAARVGVWEYDIAGGTSFLDANTAAMLALPPDEARRGIPFRCVTAKVHAADHMIGDDGQLLIETPGNIFTHILRYHPSAGIDRCAVAHGSIERDGAGMALASSGVLIDITEHALADPSWRPSADGEETAPLIQAIDAALHAHHAIKLLGASVRPTLLHLTELLLHELGRQLAGELR